MQLNIVEFIGDAKCYDYLRSVRWSSGVKCPKCGSFHIKKDGVNKITLTYIIMSVEILVVEKNLMIEQEQSLVEVLKP